MYKKPLETFLGKSERCDMTLISGALDKSVFDGNTILLKISEECDRHRYIYLFWWKNIICSFLTNDNTYKNISDMVNNITPYSKATGEENIYFLTPHFKLLKKKFSDSDLLNTNEGSLDPFHYHVSNCAKDSFEKLRK